MQTGGTSFTLDGAKLPFGASDLELVVTDTIPLSSDGRDCDTIQVVTVAPLLGEAVRRINNEESVSSLFV